MYKRKHLPSAEAGAGRLGEQRRSERAGRESCRLAGQAGWEGWLGKLAGQAGWAGLGKRSSCKGCRAAGHCHPPGLVRPARPARWWALARLMGLTNRLSTRMRGLYTCCGTGQEGGVSRSGSPTRATKVVTCEEGEGGYRGQQLTSPLPSCIPSCTCMPHPPIMHFNLHRARLIPHLLLGKAGVNHIDDAVDCERRLGNVGAHNDLAPGRPAWPTRRRSLEDALLLLRWERRIERQHLQAGEARPEGQSLTCPLRQRRKLQSRPVVCTCSRSREGRHRRTTGWARRSRPASHLDWPHRLAHLLTLLADLATCVLNLLLARQEHKHVSRRFAAVNLHHCANGRLQIVPLWFLHGGGGQEKTSLKRKNEFYKDAGGNWGARGQDDSHGISAVQMRPRIEGFHSSNAYVTQCQRRQRRRR